MKTKEFAKMNFEATPDALVKLTVDNLGINFSLYMDHEEFFLFLTEAGDALIKVKEAKLRQKERETLHKIRSRGRC